MKSFELPVPARGLDQGPMQESTTELVRGFEERQVQPSLFSSPQTRCRSASPWSELRFAMSKVS
jgi:hypothetical protein